MAIGHTFFKNLNLLGWMCEPAANEMAVLKVLKSVQNGHYYL
jgi:hypothetical protein